MISDWDPRLTRIEKELGILHQTMASSAVPPSVSAERVDRIVGAVEALMVRLKELEARLEAK